MGGVVDVLVVGAGPSGLALAAQLRAGGASVRLVDRATDRVHESRALGVQARTLEVLRPFGVADELVSRGNPAVRLRLHGRNRSTPIQLFDIGVHDTPNPLLLLVSQAENQAVLADHLAGTGVHVERGVELVDAVQQADRVSCRLRSLSGDEQRVEARYVAGCDGAHSTVRRLAGVPFTGGRYPQTFLLADLDATGLSGHPDGGRPDGAPEPPTVHAYLAEHGPFLMFPLGRPAPWRLITMRPEARGHGPTSLAELQGLCDAATGGTVRLAAPVWSAVFALSHRQVARYAAGRLFLVGDAAHIHTPVGAQGMNTGIQDAVNLGWKLALVCRGRARPELLDSYDAERRPVGRFVLRFTDRIFRVVASPSPWLRPVRSRIAPVVLPWLLRFRRGRALAFRTVSQLGIRYRGSPAVQPGAPTGRGRRPRGPVAGDRLPDLPVRHLGRSTSLQQLLTGSTFHVLLLGGGWGEAELDRLLERFGDPVRADRLDEPTGRRLGLPGGVGVLVVRPDGHIGCRTDGDDLHDAERYLATWLTSPP
jgi:2-polyprenyl-6-methoxyphenol hydroxylase-like FAD-dependent oxidoreductase